MSAALHVSPARRAGLRSGEAIGFALWVIGLAIPAMLDSAWVSVAAIFAIYAITALSEDVILGRGGMFDMGHAVYLGIGAYTTGILNTEFGWPIFATMPAAILLAAAVGALLAGPLIRLRGDYLLVATIGFNGIFVLAMQNNLCGLTGGSDGLFGIGRAAPVRPATGQPVGNVLARLDGARRRAAADAQPGPLRTRPHAALPEAGRAGRHHARRRCARGEDTGFRGRRRTGGPGRHAVRRAAVHRRARRPSCSPNRSRCSPSSSSAARAPSPACCWAPR